MPGPELATTPPSTFFYVASITYAVATLLYLVSLGGTGNRFRRLAPWLVLFAFVAHAVDISLRGFESVHPATSVRESFGFLSWILVGALLFFGRRDGLAPLGALVAPLACIMLVIARLSPSGQAVTGMTGLGRIHIATATVGVALFTLATAVSMIYLLQERNLKHKRFDGLLFRSTAALETLDRLSGRLSTVGFPIFTLSMILGAYWVSQRGGGFSRVEYPIAMITWFAFGGLVIGRQTGHLRGRRAALTTLLGFGAALVVLLLYFARRSVVS